ncbi:MAG: selenide, water dikinase SelD [Bacteroidota bacterium]
MEIPKLTQFSPGAGCGCKISPADLESILKSSATEFTHPNLIVGNDTNDDAAVYDLGDGTCIISTTDFFTPIVDDPYDFGRIAATNAISDIYAMGGVPIMAIAILGWPLDKLPKETAGIVVDGAREVCKNAGIVLAGGHSIDVSDPIFGLAVTGKAQRANVKQNNTATDGCSLFLTKPLGIGIITTAEKRGVVERSDIDFAVELMTTLNTIGAEYAKQPFIKAMTDVTGFGLLGHLLEICVSSRLQAVINMNQVPVINGIQKYTEQKTFPGGTFRNYKSYGNKLASLNEKQKVVLCDPQTSGGLLVAVESGYEEEFKRISQSFGLDLESFGTLKKVNENEPFVVIN